MNKIKKRWLVCVLALAALLCPVQVLAARSGVSLTIVANDNGSKDLGHAFLVITNKGAGSISIGPYVLKSGEQVSLGMRDSYSKHLAHSGGAYYNVEAVSPGNYKSFAYKTISISSSEAAKIGRYFQKNSYYSSLGDIMFHNCTTFAVRAWNLVAPNRDQLDEDAVDEPWKLKERIRKTPGARMDQNLIGSVLKKKQNANTIYYLSKDGKVIPYRPLGTKLKTCKVTGCSEIKLTWSAVSDKRIKGQDMITGYKLYYSTSPEKAASTVTIIGKSKTSYTLRGLMPNKTYYFKLATLFKKHGYTATGSVSSVRKAVTKNCRVKLNKTKATISMPKTKTLRLTAKSTVSHSGSLRKVIWSSSNTKVATVSSKGLVTGKGNGTAYITAKIHGKTARCKVTVKKPSVTLDKKTAVLTVGKSFRLKAKIVGASKKAVYKSSNSKIATVTQSGTVKAKAPGTVTIKVSANGVSASCKVTVQKASIRTELSGYLGKDISAALSPQNQHRHRAGTWGVFTDYDYFQFGAQQYTQDWKETSFYYSIAYVRFGVPAGGRVINGIKISGYNTTKYSVMGVYIRMSMDQAESMLQKQGWHKCTEAEKKALGIKGPRSSSSYGAADERFFTKGAYMIAMSDLNFTNIFDPHNVHAVLYGKTADLTSMYMDDGYMLE